MEQLHSITSSYNLLPVLCIPALSLDDLFFQPFFRTQQISSNKKTHANIKHSESLIGRSAVPRKDKKRRKEMFGIGSGIVFTLPGNKREVIQNYRNNSKQFNRTLGPGAPGFRTFCKTHRLIHVQVVRMKAFG